MKALITKDLIGSLKPCKDRYDNYLKFYGHKSLTRAQFMRLKNITQDDKMWVAFRLMPKENLALCSADIAESVLHIFEDAYPNDKRPREAIAGARSGDKERAHKASMAAETLVNSLPDNRARKVALATFHAVSFSPRVAAITTDAYAINAVDPSVRHEQQKLIRKIVLKHWK